MKLFFKSIQLMCQENLTNCTQSEIDGKLVYIVYILYITVGTFGSLFNLLWWDLFFYNFVVYFISVKTQKILKKKFVESQVVTNFERKALKFCLTNLWIKLKWMFKIYEYFLIKRFKVQGLIFSQCSNWNHWLFQVYWFKFQVQNQTLNN